MSAVLLFPAFDQSAGASRPSRFCQATVAMAGVSGTSQKALRRAAADFRHLADVSPRQMKKYALLLAQDEIRVANGKAATVDNAKAEAAAKALDAYAGKVCH